MIITQPSTFCAYKPSQTAAISILSMLSGSLLSSTDQGSGTSSTVHYTRLTLLPSSVGKGQTKGVGCNLKPDYWMPQNPTSGSFKAPQWNTLSWWLHDIIWSSWCLWLFLISTSHFFLYVWDIVSNRGVKVTRIWYSMSNNICGTKSCHQARYVQTNKQQDVFFQWLSVIRYILYTTTSLCVASLRLTYKSTKLNTIKKVQECYPLPIMILSIILVH